VANERTFRICNILSVHPSGKFLFLGVLYLLPNGLVQRQHGLLLVDSDSSDHINFQLTVIFLYQQERYLFLSRDKEQHTLTSQHTTSNTRWKKPRSQKRRRDKYSCSCPALKVFPARKDMKAGSELRPTSSVWDAVSPAVEVMADGGGEHPLLLKVMPQKWRRR